MTPIRLRTHAAVLFVSAAFGAAAPAAAARFEESAASYSTGWSQDTSRPWSGGTAAISATAGAQATFAFSGSTVTWIGGLPPDTRNPPVFFHGGQGGEGDTLSQNQEKPRPGVTAARPSPP